MNFPIFVPKGEVSEVLSPLRRHILTDNRWGYSNIKSNIRLHIHIRCAN